MPITLRYEPSPAVLGMSAYLIGAGKRRERQQKQAIDIAAKQADLENDRLRMMIGAEGQSEHNALAREGMKQREEFQKQDLQLRKDLSKDTGERQIARDKAVGARQVEGFKQKEKIQEKGHIHQKSQLAERGEQDTDAQLTKDVSLGKRVKNPADLPAWTQLEKEERAVENDANMRPEDREKLMEPLRARRRALLRRTEVKPEVAPEEDIKQNYRRLPGGQEMWRQPDGKWIQLQSDESAKKEEEKQRRQQAKESDAMDRDRKEAQARIDKWKANDLNIGQQPPAIDDIVEQIRKDRESLQKRFGGGAETAIPPAGANAPPGTTPVTTAPETRKKAILDELTKTSIPEKVQQLLDEYGKLSISPPSTVGPPANPVPSSTVGPQVNLVPSKPEVSGAPVNPANIASAPTVGPVQALPVAGGQPGAVKAGGDHLQELATLRQKYPDPNTAPQDVQARIREIVKAIGG